MASGPKIVHKQFNSPIGLYSQHNIQETLNKHLKPLDNGSVGIDFSDPSTGKAGNLANSAVLRMLEEEERGGHGNRRKVVWPPVPESNGYHSPQQNQPSYGLQQPPFSPSQQYSPQPPQYSPQPQQYSPQPQQYQSQPQYQPPQYQPPQRQFEPPPTTITLRQQPPVHQKPAPVYTSQPAAASFQGGANMRGDQKWPPREVREAVAAENETRRQLAKGPACRPRRIKKDYTSFFAQNALNSNYPGYKAPPGTQHYVEYPHSGQSTY